MPDAMRSPYLPPLLGVLAVAYLPHALRLPIWVTLFCLCCWAYLLLGRQREWRAPAKVWRNSLALVGSGLLLLSYGGRLGLEAGVAVLAVLLAVKPMETQSRRDAMSTLLLTSFLVVFNLFFDQDFLAAVLSLCGVLALAGGLIKVTAPGETAAHSLRQGGKLLLQGLPLALALFFVFPRLPGGLFGYQAQVTASGFNDSMAPGEVSTLALNRDVAFRVTFEGQPPPPEKRYWRGAVLWDFDGTRWQARDDIPLLQFNFVGGESISYTVNLEPYGKNWLFALDLPHNSLRWARLRQDFTLRSSLDLRGKINYSLRSYSSYTTGPMLRWEWRLGTRLPPGGNPRARELAARWRKETSSPEELALRCMDYFRTQGFRYVLAPQELGGDWLDDFLFNTREGFCGHYAAAMTFLLRAAEVPARVVSGYMGGEMNPLGDYMILRQSDAHAWVEVWLQGKGWVRMDPTAMVAPARLTEGLFAALAGGDQAAGGVSLQELPPWLRSLQLGWDAVNYYWGRAVLDYDWRTQRDLLRRLGLGFDAWRSRLLVAVLLLCIVGVGVGILLLLRRLELHRQKHQDAAQRIWDRLCRRLAKAGLPRPGWQGPLDYARDVSHKRPDLAAPMQAAAQYYAWLRYAPPAVQGDVEEFRRQVKRVRQGLGSGLLARLGLGRF